MGRLPGYAHGGLGSVSAPLLITNWSSARHQISLGLSSRQNSLSFPVSMTHRPMGLLSGLYPQPHQWVTLNLTSSPRPCFCKTELVIPSSNRASRDHMWSVPTPGSFRCSLDINGLNHMDWREIRSKQAGQGRVSES